MSRGRRDLGKTDRVYGALKLQCPSGHVVGMAVAQNGRYHLDGNPEEVEHAGGVKYRWTCKACLRAGRNPDLQASWAKLRERLEELDTDRTLGVVKYTLGGNEVR